MKRKLINIALAATCFGWTMCGNCQIASLPMEKAAGVFPGENLLQHLPFPELHWGQRSGDKNGVHISEWLSDSGETFQTFIFFDDKKATLDLYHQIDVEAGQKNCAKFAADFVEAPNQVTYPSKTWVARCGRPDGSTRVVLQKAIRGKDSFYDLKMIWKSEPSAESLKTWEKYLETVTVCDTRNQAVACPEVKPAVSSK